MARIRSSIPVEDKDLTNRFVEGVVDAMQGHADEPVIFEIPVGESGYFEVVMVWNLWADLSPDVRTRIVLEAYRRLDSLGVESVGPDHLSMVLPVTPEEAIDTGILPYSVYFNYSLRPDGHPSEPDFDQIRLLVKKEGAIELLKKDGAIESSTEPMLRLPTLQMAREALDRLREATRDFKPELRWAVTEQVGRNIDY